MGESCACVVRLEMRLRVLRVVLLCDLCCCDARLQAYSSATVRKLCCTISLCFVVRVVRSTSATRTAHRSNKCRYARAWGCVVEGMRC
jgi:hypothetical protein